MLLKARNDFGKYSVLSSNRKFYRYAAVRASIDITTALERAAAMRPPGLPMKVLRLARRKAKPGVVPMNREKTFVGICLFMKMTPFAPGCALLLPSTDDSYLGRRREDGNQIPSPMTRRRRRRDGSSPYRDVTT